MTKFFSLLVVCIFSWGVNSVYALNVVVSIPPLAGMIAPLLSKQDTLTVLLKPGVSPHGFQLHPAQMLVLDKADLIVLVDNPVDVWAHKAVQKFPQKAVRMNALPGMIHLDKNPHIWLSPDNAKILIQAVSNQLQKRHPHHQAEIKLKTIHVLDSLSNVDLRLQKQLKKVKNQPYVVLHDAYVYFTTHYGLDKGIAIQLNPSLKPSLRRVLVIQSEIRKKHIQCIFKEPQFPTSRVTYVVRGMPVKIDSLDPLGSRLGQESYEQLLTQLAKHFTTCLSPQ